jgi:hypothetical protein
VLRSEYQTLYGWGYSFQTMSKAETISLISTSFFIVIMMWVVHEVVEPDGKLNSILVFGQTLYTRKLVQTIEYVSECVVVSA